MGGVLGIIGWIFVVLGVLVFVLTLIPGVGGGWGRNGWGSGIGLIVVGAVLLVLGAVLPV